MRTSVSSPAKRTRCSRGDTVTDSGEPTVECPHCGSQDTEQESAFGSEVSKSQYYCNGCHTVFERIKWEGKQPDE